MTALRSLATCLVAALLATACSAPKDKVRIEGKIEGIKQAEFYIYNDDKANPDIDTIRIEDGKFSYERVLGTPTVLTLLYPNFSQTYVVGEPGKVIRMKGNAAKLGEADISGSEENELLTDFRLQNANKKAGEAEMAAADFIRSHPKTLAAVAVFKKYFEHVETPDAKTALSLLDVLTREQPRNAPLAATARRLRPWLNNAAGQALPDFKVETLTGRTLTRADLSGHPALVVFWASWINASNEMTGRLKRIHRAHGNRLRILSVSLDTDLRACRRRAERDSTDALTVCDGKAFDSPMVETFGIRYVPGNLLIAADGRIIARDVPASKLEQDVERLLR